MIPRNEPPEKPIDISDIFDLALDYNPMLATADLGTVRMWCKEGCDVNLDILPAMKDVIKRRQNKAKISTFSYFTNPVLAARDKRLLAPIAAKITESPSKEALAKSYAWKRKMGIWLSAHQEAILKEWEISNQLSLEVLK